MEKTRRRFCEMGPWAYWLSMKKCRFVRRVQDMFSGVRFSRHQRCEPLPVVVYAHKSLIRRTLGTVDQKLQENKAVNLSLAAPRVNGVLIRPGETFSFWRMVGPCTARRGYLPGLTISKGETACGVGGGMCQFTNLLHWMVLHTPLVITEHHHHDGYDLFPDFGRTIPFGTGTSILYNYLDYRFYNPTEQTFQILVHTDEIYLCGELRAEHALPYKYHVHAEDEYFSCEGESVYRNNRICRSRINVKTGVCEERTCIKINHAKVLYDSSGLPIRVLEKSTAGEDKP